MSDETYEPGPDDLPREQLAEYNAMWRAVADTLDEWLHRMHGVTSGSHNAGAFLEFLALNGYEVVAKPRTFTELQLLTAVEAGQVWHEFDHNNVILEDEQGQEEIDEYSRTINRFAHHDGGSVYRLNDRGKGRLAELRAEQATP